MKDTTYEFGKEFCNIERLTRYLAAIENLEDAKIIKVDTNGNFVLLFNKSK